MLYDIHEWQRLTLEPARLIAAGALTMLSMPGNPLGDTTIGRYAKATLDSFEHNTRHFGKPAFGHAETYVDGRPHAVTEVVTARTTWCDLLHFHRDPPPPKQQRLLIVAPLSGHYATLLRGTVEAFLPTHDVYITDWRNARDVLLSAPDFNLDDYIDTVIDFLHLLGEGTHVLAVCQPAVPVLAATALMNADEDPHAPASITLIGGPVDTREAPTEVNNFAKRHDLGWFKQNVIHRVPFGHAGFLRPVYPGFLQLAGFMAMNLERHMDAHWQMFHHLVDGDGESLASKRAFYEEYKAVMDLPASYYLQTISMVFHEHLLPRGLMTSRGRHVLPSAITRTALLTIEGERDDISGIGQTRAAHAICTGLPEAMRSHHEQAGVGHYGLFNGRRFRDNIAPLITAFTAQHEAAVT